MYFESNQPESPAPLSQSGDDSANPKAPESKAAAAADSEDANEGLYPIGAVASLTGLSPNTIRTWERRYAVVTPKRSPAGGRRYADSDIERLQLLRRLTQRGFPIGAASKLSGKALRARLRASNTIDASLTIRDIRVGLLHPALQARLGSVSAGWNIVRRGPDPASFIEASSTTVCDIIIAELSVLGSVPEETLERCMEATGTKDVLVLYHFARRDIMAGLVSAGARLLREPVSLDELAERVTAQVAARTPASPAAPARRAAAARNGSAQPPRYTPIQLARLREISSSVGCECPNHLSSLLTSLMAFEDYSRRCESDSPQDAELHGTLYAQTGRARMLMEELLEKVCRHDGIEL